MAGSGGAGSGASGAGAGPRACASPIAVRELVDYWASDLDAMRVEAIDEHVFACGACAAELERIHQLIAPVRNGLGPVISTAQLVELRGAGLAIEENVFEPGRRREVTFPPQLDLLIHHLGGLELREAERVSVTVRSEGSGIIIHEDPLAPFDRERGEVLIACQKHFAAFPPDILVEVRVHRGAASAAELASYPIPHVFLQADAPPSG